jgi:hypothetical protein
MHDGALFVGKDSSLRVSSANCILLTTLSTTRHIVTIIGWIGHKRTPTLGRLDCQTNWVSTPGETPEMLFSQ